MRASGWRLYLEPGGSGAGHLRGEPHHHRLPPPAAWLGVACGVAALGCRGGPVAIVASDGLALSPGTLLSLRTFPQAQALLPLQLSAGICLVPPLEGEGCLLFEVLRPQDLAQGLRFGEAVGGQPSGVLLVSSDALLVQQVNAKRLGVAQTLVLGKGLHVASAMRYGGQLGDERALADACVLAAEQAQPAALRRLLPALNAALEAGPAAGEAGHSCWRDAQATLLACGSEYTWPLAPPDDAPAVLLSALAGGSRECLFLCCQAADEGGWTCNTASLRAWADKAGVDDSMAELLPGAQVDRAVTVLLLGHSIQILLNVYFMGHLALKGQLISALLPPTATVQHVWATACNGQPLSDFVFLVSVLQWPRIWIYLINASVALCTLVAHRSCAGGRALVKRHVLRLLLFFFATVMLQAPAGVVASHRLWRITECVQKPVISLKFAVFRLLCVIMGRALQVLC